MMQKTAVRKNVISIQHAVIFIYSQRQFNVILRNDFQVYSKKWSTDKNEGWTTLDDQSDALFRAQEPFQIDLNRRQPNRTQTVTGMYDHTSSLTIRNQRYSGSKQNVLVHDYSDWHLASPDFAFFREWRGFYDPGSSRTAAVWTIEQRVQRKLLFASLTKIATVIDVTVRRWQKCKSTGEGPCRRLSDAADDDD